MKLAGAVVALPLALLAALSAAADARAQASPGVASGAFGPPRTIAIDERLAADAGLRVGDRVVLAASPGAGGDTAVVAAITKRGADPS